MLIILMAYLMTLASGGTGTCPDDYLHYLGTNDSSLTTCPAGQITVVYVKLPMDSSLPFRIDLDQSNGATVEN